jgi:hypothetical protein
MAGLKNDFQEVTKALKALTRKTEAMARKVVKLEKAQAKAKATPKPKKAVAKKATVEKKPAAKKAKARTATDQVVKIIKNSKKGVDAPTLMKKTGLAEKTVRNVLFRASKLGKIKKAGRGIYVVA